MSQIDNDEAIMFSCQPYEIGINAPYENIELLIKQGSYIKPKAILDRIAELQTTQPSNTEDKR